MQGAPARGGGAVTFAYIIVGIIVARFVAWPFVRYVMLDDYTTIDIEAIDVFAAGVMVIAAGLVWPLTLVGGAIGFGCHVVAERINARNKVKR